MMLCVGLASPGRGGDLVKWVFPQASGPAAPLTLQQLAHEISHVESEIARGTIGVKAPDVWGQNRMTKYRAEYEKTMAKNLEKFSVMLQGGAPAFRRGRIKQRDGRQRVAFPDGHYRARPNPRGHRPRGAGDMRPPPCWRCPRVRRRLRVRR